MHRNWYRSLKCVVCLLKDRYLWYQCHCVCFSSYSFRQWLVNSANCSLCSLNSVHTCLIVFVFMCATLSYQKYFFFKSNDLRKQLRRVEVIETKTNFDTFVVAGLTISFVWKTNKLKYIQTHMFIIPILMAVLNAKTLALIVYAFKNVWRLS